MASAFDLTVSPDPASPSARRPGGDAGVGAVASTVLHDPDGRLVLVYAHEHPPELRLYAPGDRLLHVIALADAADGTVAPAGIDGDALRVFARHAGSLLATGRQLAYPADRLGVIYLLDPARPGRLLVTPALADHSFDPTRCAPCDPAQLTAPVAAFTAGVHALLARVAGHDLLAEQLREQAAGFDAQIPAALDGCQLPAPAPDRAFTCRRAARQRVPGPGTSVAQLRAHLAGQRH